MLSAKARTELNLLIARLGGWQTAVPERAVRFHLVREELRVQITNALPFWYLWIDDNVVNRHKALVALLGHVADPLIELFRKTDILASEVRRLAGRAAGDEELTAWLEGKSREWLVRVEMLGANCERRTDMRAEEKHFADLEDEVRRHHDAINQLREAQRVLTTLTSMHAATLAAGLPELRKRLYKDGCTYEWLDDIKKLVQPLKAAADRMQDPPPELGVISSILTELRSWSAHLGSDLHKEVEELEQKRRFKVVDWEPEEVKELGVEAQGLRERLLDQAAALRDEKLRELEQQIADLRQACGYDPALEERFERLRQRSFNRPHLFQDWLEELNRFQHSFKAIAQSNIGTLETRLSDTKIESEARIKSLNARPLSAANSAAVLLLEQSLRDLPTAAEVEEVLQQLRRVNEIAREIDRLDQQAAQELDEVERKQDELSARYATLQTEAQRVRGVKFEVPDLAAQIASLSDGAARVSLEERKRQALALETSLNAIESRFAERCRDQLAVQLLDMQRAVEVLRRAGATPPSADPPEIAIGVAPNIAAQAVLDARKIYSVLRRMAREARKDLDSRRLSLQADLGRLHLDDLTPGDRQESERLQRDLAEDAWSRPQDPMEQLKRMAILIERCDNFFTRLQKEQRTALNRLAELERSFRDFNEDQLDRFCPVWADRVAALIYGIPAQPRQWSAVQHQLNLAADLFSRVKPQAMRLAAEELELAAEALRQRLRSGGGGSGGDPSFADFARNLLAELDTYGAEVLPPANLRLRVLNASQRQA